MGYSDCKMERYGNNKKKQSLSRSNDPKRAQRSSSELKKTEKTTSSAIKSVRLVLNPDSVNQISKTKGGSLMEIEEGYVDEIMRTNSLLSLRV